MPIVGSNGGGNSSSVPDSQEGISWELNGNANTTEEHFLGTVDGQPLRIRTNNQQRVIIDENGRVGVGTNNPQHHIHIKSHLDYDNSGLKIDTFAAEFEDTQFNIIYSYVVPLGSVNLIQVNFVAKEGITNRCGLRKSLVVFRNGGIAQIQNNLWQSDFTMKSNSNFDVRYRIQMDTIHFEVKNANISTTKWSGHIQIETII